MKYVLLICDDETRTPSQQQIRADPTFQTWLGRHGPQLFGARLRPTDYATTVRVRDGETLVSDGPFAETKDFVGGITAVECESLDEAIEIAAGRPTSSTDRCRCSSYAPRRCSHSDVAADLAKPATSIDCDERHRYFGHMSREVRVPHATICQSTSKVYSSPPAE